MPGGFARSLGYSAGYLKTGRRASSLPLVTLPGFDSREISPLRASQRRRTLYRLGRTQGRRTMTLGLNPHSPATLTRAYSAQYGAAAAAGFRRGVINATAGPAGPNIGSFKTRAGQYVKGRGGRFIGSR